MTGDAVVCARCRQPIEADSRFCRHCGVVHVEAPAAGASPPETSGIATSDGAGWWVAAAMIIAVVSVLVFAVQTAPSRQTATDPLPVMATALDNDAAAPLPSSTASPHAENWTYSTAEDQVRGATTYFASTTSTNTVAQAAPYDGGTTMTITVRRSPAYGSDVMLGISEGQLMCPSYEGCSGTVRFDQGPPQRIRFNGAADNSSETIFVANPASFIARLKRAKRVVIEKTLYQAGNPQFTFDVAGLRWNH